MLEEHCRRVGGILKSRRQGHESSPIGDHACDVARADVPHVRGKAASDVGSHGVDVLRVDVPLLDGTSNELIRETLNFQHTHFHIFRLMFHSRVTEEALDEHEAILAAFASADPAAAEKAMRAHIEHSRDRLLPAFD